MHLGSHIYWLIFSYIRVSLHNVLFLIREVIFLLWLPVLCLPFLSVMFLLGETMFICDFVVNIR